MLVFLIIPSQLFAIIPASEREALIAIYNATGGPNWRNNYGWLGPWGTEGGWYGVTVDEQYGHVIGLDLDDNNLIGTVPDEIRKLNQISTLDLSGNKLEGPLPAGMVDLYLYIERLDLSGNHFSGPIPEWLRYYRVCRDLNLGDNQFTGPIPEWIGELWVNLNRLALYGNNLSGDLPPTIASLTRLEILELSGNSIGGTIPAVISNLSSLRGLGLQGCELGGSIPVWVGDLINLNYLFLGSNHLTGSIPTDLGNLHNLWGLYLNDNQLTGTIPASLGNLSNLSYLRLENNLLEGPIPPELGQLTNITSLELQHNNLSGSVPSNIFNMSPTVGANVDLSYNQLNGISDDIQPKTGFLNINLDMNLIESLPGTLGNCNHLRGLVLSRNLLSGPFPLQLTQLTQINYLNLAQNQLEGAIPHQIGEMSQLSHIEFTGNMFSGEIPHEIKSLTNLAGGGLGLSYNALFTTDDTVRVFVNDHHYGDFESTQTVPPDQPRWGFQEPDTLQLTWTPIEYDEDDGFYQVYQRQESSGEMVWLAETPDKTAAGIIIEGVSLNAGTRFFVRTVTRPHQLNPNTVYSEYREAHLQNSIFLEELHADLTPRGAAANTAYPDTRLYRYYKILDVDRQPVPVQPVQLNLNSDKAEVSVQAEIIKPGVLQVKLDLEQWGVHAGDTLNLDFPRTIRLQENGEWKDYFLLEKDLDFNVRVQQKRPWRSNYVFALGGPVWEAKTPDGGEQSVASAKLSLGAQAGYTVKLLAADTPQGGVVQGLGRQGDFSLSGEVSADLGLPGAPKAEASGSIGLKAGAYLGGELDYNAGGWTGAARNADVTGALAFFGNFGGTPVRFLAQHVQTATLIWLSSQGYPTAEFEPARYYQSVKYGASAEGRATAGASIELGPLSLNGNVAFSGTLQEGRQFSPSGQGDVSDSLALGLSSGAGVQLNLAEELEWLDSLEGVNRTHSNTVQYEVTSQGPEITGIGGTIETTETVGASWLLFSGQSYAGTRIKWTTSDSKAIFTVGQNPQLLAGTLSQVAVGHQPSLTNFTPAWLSGDIKDFLTTVEAADPSSLTRSGAQSVRGLRAEAALKVPIPHLKGLKLSLGLGLYQEVEQDIARGVVFEDKSYLLADYRKHDWAPSPAVFLSTVSNSLMTTVPFLSDILRRLIPVAEVVFGKSGTTELASVTGVPVGTLQTWATQPAARLSAAVMDTAVLADRITGTTGDKGGKRWLPCQTTFVSPQVAAVPVGDPERFYHRTGIWSNDAWVALPATRKAAVIDELTLVGHAVHLSAEDEAGELQPEFAAPVTLALVVTPEDLAIAGADPSVLGELALYRYESETGIWSVVSGSVATGDGASGDVMQSGLYAAGWLQAVDPEADPDADGRTTAEEDANGNGVIDPGETNPHAWDTDGDGYTDGEEVAAGSDPLDPTSHPAACVLRVQSGAHGLTWPTPGSYTYPDGWTVRVAGLPDPGYVFSHWSGDYEGSENPLVLVLDHDYELVPHFIVDPDLLLGDLNLDGVVDAVDFELFALYLSEAIVWGEAGFIAPMEAADLNADGRVDVLDMVWMSQV
ncbi:MAG TPA: dockerin type I domain-containing protein [Acidobacteriota bacterium]|nr:dockerin type I domain-containing protein [Acidobacteriota bacterium]